MNTYSWTFQSLDVHPLEDGLVDVIKKAQGTLTADDGLGHTASQMLVITLGPPDPLTFIPFEDVTLADVTGWVEAAMAPASLAGWKATLDDRIYDDVETPEMAPPWL